MAQKERKRKSEFATTYVETQRDSMAMKERESEIELKCRTEKLDFKRRVFEAEERRKDDARESEKKNQRMQMILEMKRAGMSVDEIKEVLDIVES